jgi:hypothetical protein
VNYLADRLAELGDSVPERIEGFRLDPAGGPAKAGAPAGVPAKATSPFKDKRLYDFRRYPADLYLKPAHQRPTAPPWPAGVPGSTRLAPRNTAGPSSWSPRLT